MIERVMKEDNFEVLSNLLNASFSTVASEFSLNMNNCPTNCAFITSEQLYEQLSDRHEYYYFKESNHIIGFIAIEKSKNDDTIYYIEKLGVHPEFRNKKIGWKLMSFAIARIKRLGGKMISIGIIDTNFILKRWYCSQGFEEVEIKSYDHLPFKVCIMNKLV